MPAMPCRSTTANAIASSWTPLRRVASAGGAVEHRIVKVDLAAFGGSALTDAAHDIPESPTTGIPITYVPARNTVFLALALAWAETLPTRHLFIGVNAVDYSGYPDCRPAFIAAFQELANVATKMAVEGDRIVVHTPLIDLTKAEIIHRGSELGVDYAVTVSCYQPSQRGEACGVCDSCRIRRAGFETAGTDGPDAVSGQGIGNRAPWLAMGIGRHMRRAGWSPCCRRTARIQSATLAVGR